MATTKKVLLPDGGLPDFSGLTGACPDSLFERGQWPAHWCHSPTPPEGPQFLLFRRRIRLEKPLHCRIHLSADERYQLRIDGRLVSEGPERGDPDDWFFDTVDLELDAGEHRLLARVQALGAAAPRAQISLRPGFLLAPESKEAFELLATGVADWEVAALPGYQFRKPFEDEPFSVGYDCIHDGRRIDRALEAGEGAAWVPAVKGLPGANPDLRNRYPSTHLLSPGRVPPRRREAFTGGRVRVVETMPAEGTPEGSPYPDPAKGSDSSEDWTRLYQAGKALQIPSGTRLRVLIDFEDYLGVDYAVAFRGAPGARITVGLAESLFEDASHARKGIRNEVGGKYFYGIGDSFIASGADTSECFESVFWRSGRFIELCIETKGSPMTIESLEIFRVGFPLNWDYHFSCDDPSLQIILPLVERTLAASTDDSFMDGPYYEQMLWVGDQVQTQLAHFVMHRDSSLARKAIRSFDASRLKDGLTCARWPARDRMIIPAYSLYWIDLIHNYHYWRGEAEVLKTHLRGARGVIDAFLGMRNQDGLLEVKKGWNIVDWVPEWPMGVPPGADGGVSSILNWQFVETLGKMAELENSFGEPEMAARANRIADEVAGVLNRELWDESCGLFRDAPGAGTYSEHAQALAILSGRLPAERVERMADFTERSLTPATIAFSHHVFEALFKIRRPMPFFDRLEEWKRLPGQGFLTLPEGPEPSRSDCHAWGSHPLYHFMASVLGLRPARPGFQEISIRPQLGPLKQAQGRLPHPLGPVEVKFEKVQDRIHAELQIPEHLSGQLWLNGECHPLEPGVRRFD